MHNLSGDYYYKTPSTIHTVPILAAGIGSGLLLSSPWSSQCSPPLQASITKQIMAAGPSPPAKLIKTSIRANPLAIGLCGACSSSLAVTLNTFTIITSWNS
jgi:hypothetical protein